MSNDESSADINQEVLLIEYQKSQDSAQHHATMSWTATSIMWAASLVLIGFVYSNLTNSTLNYLLTLICVIGILLVVAVNLIDINLENVMIQKYKRCKEIEKLLGMRQHSSLVSSGISFRLIYNIITFSFIVAWLSTLCSIWC